MSSGYSPFHIEYKSTESNYLQYSFTTPATVAMEYTNIKLHKIGQTNSFFILQQNEKGYFEERQNTV